MQAVSPGGPREAGPGSAPTEGGSAGEGALGARGAPWVPASPLLPGEGTGTCSLRSDADGWTSRGGPSLGGLEPPALTRWSELPL